MSLRDAAAARHPSYVERLGRLVNIDSGSRDLPGLHDVATTLAAWCTESGLATRLVPVYDAAMAPLGDAVVARVRGTGTRRILLAGHLDTVFAAGTAAARPFRVDGTKAFGPGVCDDKGGVLAGLCAVETLLDTGRTAFGELTLLATPDEEIGSVGSRSLLGRLAVDTDVALCLECARENGDLVSARKGVADVELLLRGRAAHAGIEPERGANAALAAARLTVALQELNGRWPSVTVNVGVLQAGQRANVVADQARLVVDLRADRTGAFDEALAAVEALSRRPFVDGVTVELAVHAPTPPWERSPATGRLVELAAKVGAGIGVPVRDAATGGCADANLLAAAGLAVLDGLGPVGGNDHSSDEWLDLASVPDRVALLAGLVDAAARDGV
ncbi:M20/M25/M40 family metallo-hydrolase [Dactylosporangium aurantiacum]|uniref:M20/M25/M40 family metallo-hydrolase n=1 Tax=Dactylosporangium aurantiacum TaxID=35754 RepID=A0A9Q9IC45_9ACTN|nr:M20/M25/M40 family metallo-hydrolase [Dactylosporangium aurantiacum]MDG6109567.1 M20/M25/M40 family metallo-hydrolase [Dactylosporangium aurantiacum]UWZ51277.1 M20/M25/M40 family metallo-hydrolase [Dactylosporangium aurantiacum]